MHLEAMIVRMWKPELSNFGDTLGGHKGVRLEVHLHAVVTRVWTSTLMW
jgi:hypothetical protein